MLRWSEMRTRVSEKGQITVPKPLRERLGIRPGDELEVVADGGRLLMTKAVPSDPVASVYGVLGEGLDTDAVVEELRGSAEEA